METKKEKRIVFVCSEQLAEIVKNLMEKYGETESSIMRRAIIELNRKEFKDYIENRPSGKMSVEEKVDYDLKKAEIKKQKHEEKQKAICVKLNGKLERSNNGFVCRYFNYSRHGKHEQVLPLDYLNEEIIENQYQPSKEKLKELIKKGVINLDLK